MKKTNKLQLTLTWIEEEHSRDASRSSDKYTLSGGTLRHERSTSGAHRSAGQPELRSVTPQDLLPLEGTLQGAGLLQSRTVRLPGDPASRSSVEVDLSVRLSGQTHTLKVAGPLPDGGEPTDSLWKGLVELRDALDGLLPESE